jgi:tetratricopeptide (TPR) repeat protein
LPFFEKALAARKKVLGEEHPDTARGYNDVAACLESLGRAARALPLFEKALALRKKSLGKEHPATGQSYNNVAFCLQSLGRMGQALPLYEKALAVFKKALGEEHPDTASSYNNLGYCLQSLGRSTEALPLYEKGLAARKKVLGEDHPDTTRSYNSVAYCLQSLSRSAQALPLYEKALAARKKALGEDHPDTARTYNNVGYCLESLGRPAQALPFYEKALAMRKKALGEEHSDTAQSYNNVAYCLEALGRAAQALPLYEKGLELRKKVQGKEHPDTAQSYNNVAYCLQSLGRSRQALPLYEKALAMRKKALGEKHPDTAQSYSNVAYCLEGLGRAAQALPLYEKALVVRRKAFGEDHRDTAQNYSSMAVCLGSLGRSAEALPFYEKALAARKKLLGEEHIETAQTYENLAFCHLQLGKAKVARKAFNSALLGHSAGRLSKGGRGFERAMGEGRSPYAYLALMSAGDGKPAEAWRHAEAGLARNLLEDLAESAPTEDMQLAASLRALDQQVLALLSKNKREAAEQKLLDDLSGQRKAVSKEMARRMAERSALLVWPLDKVQKYVPNDAAVVFWLETSFHGVWACVVRARGEPRWVRLKGTGAKGAWTKEDSKQGRQLADQIAASRAPADLAASVQRRWFEPLAPHLKAGDGLARVSKLYIVPEGPAAALPFEVLAPEYEISYTPSATLLAQARSGHRGLEAGTALALGDPVFRPAGFVKPPAYGLLLVQVLPKGNADKAGLRAGDLLLRYADKPLDEIDDLASALKEKPKAEAVYWRDGKKQRVQLAGPLGVRLDKRSGPIALADWRGQQSVLRDSSYQPLPGTRAEVQALQRLLGKGCTTLLGSDASEQKLEEMAPQLKKYRILHLATHGTVDLDQPERSALILARDKLPTLNDNEERVRLGKKPITGELTVATILDQWKLDADLVVLSACRTGQGKASAGDGLLGFSYALQRAGARSVVLSRWQVDDRSTALFMLRFYENLLGKREGLKKPLGRAAALAEARRWLRELPRAKVEQLCAALSLGKLESTRGSVVPLKVKPGEVKLPAGDKPYAHPFHWAAFILLGDPD